MRDIPGPTCKKQTQLRCSGSTLCKRMGSKTFQVLPVLKVRSNRSTLWERDCLPLNTSQITYPNIFNRKSIFPSDTYIIENMFVLSVAQVPRVWAWTCRGCCFMQLQKWTITYSVLGYGSILISLFEQLSRQKQQRTWKCGGLSQAASNSLTLTRNIKLSLKSFTV